MIGTWLLETPFALNSISSGEHDSPRKCTERAGETLNMKTHDIDQNLIMAGLEVSSTIQTQIDHCTCLLFLFFDQYGCFDSKTKDWKGRCQSQLFKVYSATIPSPNLLLPGQKKVLGLNLTTQGRATVDLLAKEKKYYLAWRPSSLCGNWSVILGKSTLKFQGLQVHSGVIDTM